jgi:hypothetical protein
VGVLGRSGAAVAGEESAGVCGSSASRNGVLGVSSSSYGVRGKSANNSGVYGITSAPAVTPVTNIPNAGVTGFSLTAYGVLASSRDAAGVRGSSSNSYGGEFNGGKAPVRLIPHASHSGKPTTGTHKRGELFADAAGALWYCTHDGTPGTWRRVSLV